MPTPADPPEDDAVETRLSAAWVFLRGERRDFARTGNWPEPALQADGRHLVMAAPLDDCRHLGGVGLVLTREEAVGIAAAMFQVSPEELSEADIDDACGEACNVMSACLAATLGKGDSPAFQRARLLQAEGYQRVARNSGVLTRFATDPDAGHVTLTVFDPLALPTHTGEDT